MSANRLLYAKENKYFNKEEVHHCVLFCFIFVCAYVYMRVIYQRAVFERDSKMHLIHTL